MKEDPDRKKVESKILCITNLATKAAFNIKATEIENRTSNTTGITTTPEFNKLTKTSFDARMKKQQKVLKIRFK